MILQSLTDCYEALAKNGKVPRPGWTKVKVSYAVEIDDDGKVISAHSLKIEINNGKKNVLLPREIELPAPVKRASNIAPNFLCDNAKYVFGYAWKFFEKYDLSELALLYKTVYDCWQKAFEMKKTVDLAQADNRKEVANLLKQALECEQKAIILM